MQHWLWAARCERHCQCAEMHFPWMLHCVPCAGALLAGAGLCLGRAHARAMASVRAVGLLVHAHLQAGQRPARAARAPVCPYAKMHIWQKKEKKVPGSPAHPAHMGTGVVPTTSGAQLTTSGALRPSRTLRPLRQSRRPRAPRCARARCPFWGCAHAWAAHARCAALRSSVVHRGSASRLLRDPGAAAAPC